MTAAAPRITLSGSSLRVLSRPKGAPPDAPPNTPPVSPAVCQKLKLSQAEFSAALGISRRTLENWEQGRRTPSGTARVLLTIAERHPHVVLESL